MRRRSRAAIVAAVATALAAPLGLPARATGTPTIRTVVGGPGRGPGPEVGSQVRLVRLSRDGGTLYVADDINAVVRALDLTTGFERPIAGTGSFGYSGDGGPATNAQINDEQATGIAVDAAGDVFFSDSNDNRVRRIGTDGIITTIAGNGTAGFSGDGGPATSAQLSGPTGLDFDAQGNLYIADWKNQRIRKVDTAGVITTVAGNGQVGNGGDTGPALGAQFNYPMAVAALPNGDLLVADTFNHRIRRIGANGIVTGFAGLGCACYAGDGSVTPLLAGFNLPFDINVGTDGSVFVADYGNNRVRRIGPDGHVSTVAGNGAPAFAGDGLPAVAASLNGPTGVAVDSRTGAFYIADLANLRARKVDAAGVIHTVAGNGTLALSGDGRPAVDAQTNGEFGMDMDAAGNLFIADAGNSVIREVDTAGVIHTVAGNGTPGYSGDFGPATSAELQYPYGVAVDPHNDTIYIADSFNFRIRKVDPATGVITTIAGVGAPGYTGDGGPAAAAMVGGVISMRVGPDGSLYFTDTSNNRIRRIKPDGNIDTVAGDGQGVTSGDGGHVLAAGINHPTGLALGADGSMYIAEQLGGRIRKVAPDSTITTIAGTSNPLDRCWDVRLEQPWVPPADLGDGGPATSAQLSCPTGVAVDAAGDVFIADFNTNRVRMVAPNGIITTVAGSNDFGMAGDSGPAASARIYGPTDLIVNQATSTLFYVDEGNNRVRAIDGLVR